MWSIVVLLTKFNSYKKRSMDKPSKEVRNSIEKIVEYNYSDELKDWEATNGDVPKEAFNDPEILFTPDHIFYHLLIVNQYLNE